MAGYVKNWPDNLDSYDRIIYVIRLIPARGRHRTKDGAMAVTETVAGAKDPNPASGGDLEGRQCI